MRIHGDTRKTKGVAADDESGFAADSRKRCEFIDAARNLAIEFADKFLPDADEVAGFCSLEAQRAQDAF